MTTQLPSRERSDVEVRGERQSPDVLFEEARQRRRRRWMTGSVVVAAVVIAGAVMLDMSGGGGRGPGGTANDQPSGSGSGATSGHVAESRLFPGAPSSGRFYTGPGAGCPLAHRNRYLPAWSGCVSAIVADVSGSGRRDLVMTYSRLGHVSLGSRPRPGKPGQSSKLYPAEQAMLRIVSPDGHVTTAPIDFMTTPLRKTRPRLYRAGAAALISVAHVGDEPGKEIFLQTGQISSGSLALAYGFHHDRLVASGVTLAYDGDSIAQSGFQCVAGDPPRLIQSTYSLIRGIKAMRNPVHIYGRWNVTTKTFAWHGPRLVKIAQSTLKRRLLPKDNVGDGCTRGVG